MRESSKKNLKIIWLVIVVFGLISGGTLVSFALKHSLWLLPLCPVIVVLMYYLSLFFRYKSYSILYDKKGYDTSFIYMDPFYILFKDPDKKIFGRVHNKNYFSIGEIVPKFNLPQNREEFDKLKADFTFTVFESIAGSFILLVLSCLAVYFIYVYVFSEVLLFFFDVALIFLILFSSTQILFTLLEGEICLGVPNDKIDTGEVDEEGKHIIKHVLTDEQYDYLLACKLLIYGSYNERNKGVKRTYLLKIISDYLNKELTIDDVSRDDIKIVDYILREYLDMKITRLNSGIEKYINYLYSHFDTIAVEKTSRFKDDTKAYLVICSHMVMYYIKKGDTSKAKELFDKLSNINFDEKKDKDLIYLRSKNAAFLGLDNYDIDEVLKEDNIVYNGLDVFSKFTEDYIEVEKDSKFFLESIEDREERLKRREERKALREEKEDKEEKEEKKKHLFGKKDKKDKKDKKHKDDESLVNGEVSLENEFEYEEAEAETSEIIDDVKEEINEDTKLSEDILGKKDNDTIVNDIENEESYEVRERDTKYDTKAFWDEADDMLKKNFLSD